MDIKQEKQIIISFFKRIKRDVQIEQNKVLIDTGIMLIDKLLTEYDKKYNDLINEMGVILTAKEERINYLKRVINDR